jgi:hypothetical protein
MEDVVLTRVEPAKLCKDCRWVERGWWGFVDAVPKCMRGEAIRLRKIDLVFGQVRLERSDREYAATMRLGGEPCGPDAKLFEPRR